MEQEHVIINQQDQVEVFANDFGGITIKSTDHFREECFIYFGIEHTEMIIKAIRSAKRDALDRKNG